MWHGAATAIAQAGLWLSLLVCLMWRGAATAIAQAGL